MKHLLLAAALLTAITATAQDEWATHIRCDVSQASSGLQKLYSSEGAQPRYSLDLYNQGQRQAPPSGSYAVMQFAPSATNETWVAVTNTATGDYSYTVQFPVLPTNTVATGDWWYTAYFYTTNSYRYWTGSGALEIEETTATGDDLEWVTIVNGVTCSTVTGIVDTAILAATATVYTAGTDYTDAATTTVYAAGTSYTDAATTTVYAAGTTYTDAQIALVGLPEVTAIDPVTTDAITVGGLTTAGTVTIDSANAHTNTYGGMLGVGAARWQDSGGDATGTSSHADSLGDAIGVASHADSGGHAAGVWSHASGSGARAIHDQSWVANGGGDTTPSTATQQATMHFDNGIRLLGAAGVEIEAGLTVGGNAVVATNLTVDGVTTIGGPALAANTTQLSITNATNGEIVSVDEDGNVSISGICSTTADIPLDVQASNNAGSGDYIFRVGDSGNGGLMRVNGLGALLMLNSVTAGGTAPAVNWADASAGDADWNAKANADDLEFKPDADAPYGANTVLTMGGDGEVTIADCMRLTPVAACAVTNTGTIFYDSDDNKVKVWTGAAWENLN